MEKAIKQLKKLEKLGSDMRLAAESWQKPWQSLLSTMLSARTRDEVTIAVCNVLFRRYKSADAVAKANTGAIRKIIKPKVSSIAAFLFITSSIAKELFKGFGRN